MIYQKLALYYDLFIDEELIDLYVKEIKHHHKEGTVLDLGTGTGPLAIKLAKENYHVTATDISSEMLEVAYNNALNADVKVHFFIHDILDIVNIDYNIITMCTDVINYLKTKEDILKALTNVSLAMNKDAIFLFDALRPQYIEKVSGHKEDILLKDDVLTWHVTKTNIQNQIKHTIKIGNHYETHLQQAYTVKEMNTLLKEANLSPIKKIKLEERILYICKKAG